MTWAKHSLTNLQGNYDFADDLLSIIDDLCRVLWLDHSSLITSLHRWLDSSWREATDQKSAMMWPFGSGKVVIGFSSTDHPPIEDHWSMEINSSCCGATSSPSSRMNHWSRLIPFLRGNLLVPILNKFYVTDLSHPFAGNCCEVNASSNLFDDISLWGFFCGRCKDCSMLDWDEKVALFFDLSCWIWHAMDWYAALGWVIFVRRSIQ